MRSTGKRHTAEIEYAHWPRGRVHRETSSVSIGDAHGASPVRIADRRFAIVQVSQSMRVLLRNAPQGRAVGAVRRSGCYEYDR